MEFELIAAEESAYHRTEIRKYEGFWQAVYMRRSTEGGWYVRDAITVKDTNGNDNDS